MKATEFANYFEFSLSKLLISEVPEEERGDFDDSVTTVYAATDNESVFCTRYFDNIRLLTEQFDSLLADYVDEDLEEDGFHPNEQEPYYQQALRWVENNLEYKGTGKHEIIACLVNPDLIEDDVEEVA